MSMPDDDQILARIHVSPVRRLLAYGVQLSLGALLVYASFAGLAGVGSSIILLVLGVLVLFAAEKMRRATRLALYLTDEGLFDTSGTMLAGFDDIEAVNRGALAMKPSNGFALVMKTKQPRAWVPGLWWRAGRRVGVGGVTSAGASKFMAEQIALRLAGTV